MQPNGNKIAVSSEGELPQPAQSQAALVANALSGLTMQLQRIQLSRSLGSEMFEGNRKLDEALGYPATLIFSDFYSFYRRNRLAKRLNNLPANECWRKPPVISDGESKTRFSKEEKEKLGNEMPDDTEFIAGLKQIIKKRHLWTYLHRADKLAGIGQYGVLLIGTRSPGPTPTGQTTFSQPVVPGSLNSPDDIVFLRALTEDSAQVDTKEFDKNTASERFGLPLWYKVSLGEGLGQQPVHYSRLIHIAEELEENELFGVPRLEDAYDMLLALKMVWGAGSEAVWRSAFQKIAASINKETEFGTIEQDALTEQLEALVHGLKQWVYAQGVDSFETIGGDIVDVSSIFDVLISLVSGEIPKHILLGTQQGELASAQQDARHWSSHINYRRANFCDTVIIRPFIDRLIEYGAVPEPEDDDYLIDWESNFELDEKQKATVRKTEAEAQETEWEGQKAPVITRWKDARGEDGVTQLLKDFEETQENDLSPAESNFEPSTAQ